MSSLDGIGKKFSQPLDRAAIGLMLVLSVAIALLLFGGDSTAPRVRDFTWQNKQIAAEDRAFIVTFSRPMDRESVEENLQIEPPLSGKFSWAGRRMAYTLEYPVPYGTEFKVELEGAHDRFSQGEKTRTEIEPFVAEFQSRDRAMIYLGVEQEELGRLILYNLTQQKKTVLTPKELVVMDYKPYPNSDRILFSATESLARGGILEQKLYTVTTGIDIEGSRTDRPAGKIEQVLDSKEYQNLSFDLSPDGKTILVQRVSKRNPGSFGLWMLKEGQRPIPLENEPGGDFLITPDSQAVALAQGQGLAILPLEPKAEPVDFLPQFGRVLSFSPDGSAAAMVKFNTDYTRSLYIVTTAGIQKEIRRLKGSILSAQFDPLGKTLYCLLTKLIEGQEEYKEEPYIAAINIESGKLLFPPVLLPDQREIQMSVSPDGLGLLFDQIVTTNPPTAQSNMGGPRTNSGEAVTKSRLWLLPLDPTAAPETNANLNPEQLPFAGFRPRWLP